MSLDQGTTVDSLLRECLYRDIATAIYYNRLSFSTDAFDHLVQQTLHYPDTEKVALLIDKELEEIKNEDQIKFEMHIAKWQMWIRHFTTSCASNDK